MFDELLEDIAQKNGLYGVNTYLKLATGIGGILLCLLSTGYIAPVFIAGLLCFSLVFLARISIRTIAGLFIVPFWFAFMSVTGLVLVYGGSPVYWSWNPVPWIAVSITRESVNQGFFVFSRVIGGMSALFFICLTTPMTDLFAVMRRCRIPGIIVELTMIIYRTIFILIDQVIQIYHAQVMRLGYSGIRDSVRSCSTLCGAAFIASWDAGEDLIQAMDARCYNGKFAVLGENRPIEKRPLLAVAAFLALSAIVVILSAQSTII